MLIQSTGESEIEFIFTRSEMRDPRVGLLGPAQVRLWNQHVTHGQHAQATQLLGRIKHHRWETGGHLGVESNLNTCLDLVLALYQQIQQLLGIDYSLSVIRHQTNESGIPLVHDLSKGGGSRGHQDLTHSVVVPTQRLIVHTEEALGRPLLCHLVLQVPYSVAVSKLLVLGATLKGIKGKREENFFLEKEIKLT